MRFLKNLSSWQVIAVGRNETKLQQLGTDYIVYDLSQVNDNCYNQLHSPDVLIHLAWERVHNYQDFFQLEKNLINSYRFLQAMIQQGLPNLTVAGTGYEYGLQCGCLKEESPTDPTTCYGIAKDALRRSLESIQEKFTVKLRWLRLFFMYGDGQQEKALIAQLDKAIAFKQEVFDMSGGEQLRDYLPVEEMGALIAKVALQSRYNGIFNICSGKPISIRNLVEQHLAQKGAKIRLNLGKYPYPKHEPMAYWGDSTRLHFAVSAFEEEQKYAENP